MLYGAAIAAACLCVGLVLFFVTQRRGQPHQASGLMLAWLLVGLTPVFLVFSFFPDSTVSGEVQGFTFTGAFAAFVFIWLYGTRQSTRLLTVDRLQQQLDEERTAKEMIQQQAASSSDRADLTVLRQQRVQTWRLAGRPDRCVHLITGDLAEVSCADVWVNSENNNMQMSRFYESTISAVIRYRGARRDERGALQEDVIGEELRALMGEHVSVEPGSVLVTGPGQLRASNGVRAVLHLAAVVGEPMSGYRRVQDVARCVTAVLERTEALELAPPASSVLLPLLGTGSGRADLEETCRCMIEAAVAWLASPRSQHVRSVYLLAYRAGELRTCEAVLEGRDDVLRQTDPAA